MDKNKRQSNIELLRILAMCGVIILHYNNATIGGGLEYAHGMNLYILYCFESLFACAVNLFVLISGYFMCTKLERTLDKPFELLIQVILFNECFYLVSVFMHHKPINAKHIFGRLVPGNWFVILYITLYIVSPFLNMIIEKIENCGMFKRGVTILILLFSVYPTLVDVLAELTHKQYVGLSSVGMYGSQWGYSIVNFCLMYMIGAYLRLHPDMSGRAKHGVRIFVGVIVLTAWALVNNKIGFETERTAWEYCNPLVIFMAVEIFKMFSKINIGQRKLINQLAKATFIVYLMHNKFLKFLHIPQFVSEMPIVMILHIIISVLIIYAICMIVYLGYNKSIAKILRIIYNRFPILKKDIFKEEWR